MTMIPAAPIKNSSIIRRKKRPEDMPKQPLSAYTIFFCEECQRCMTTANSTTTATTTTTTTTTMTTTATATTTMTTTAAATATMNNNNRQQKTENRKQQQQQEAGLSSLMINQMHFEQLRKVMLLQSPLHVVLSRMVQVQVMVLLV